MKVLGIHAYIHDSAVCLITDEGVVAVAEERLSRERRDASFPRKAIDYVLSASKIRNINEIDLVVFDLFERQGDIVHLGIRQLNYRGEVVSIRHHDAHAASAFYASPFEEAAVLVADAGGSFSFEVPPGQPQYFITDETETSREIQSIYRAADNKIHAVRRTFTSSGHAIGPGFLFGLACEFLGFDRLDGDSLTALAAGAEGRDGRLKESPFVNMSGEIVAPIDRRVIQDRDWGKISAEIFHGVGRRMPGAPALEEHRRLARYAQEATEEAMLQLAKNLFDITHCRNLCLAGGVAFNGRANMRILDETPFEEVFVQPAAGDSGCAVGCALYGRHVVAGMKERLSANEFAGKRYHDGEIDNYLMGLGGVSVSRGVNLKEIAAAIAEGKIVGWYDGRSEFAPRSAGHRSILADPRSAEVKARLNAGVEKAETFPSYSAAVLEERVSDYFDFNRPSPFMSFAVKVLPGREKEIPAALLPDGASAVLTVGRDGGRFRRLVEEFHAITGVPVLLNADFGANGEPLVETTEDAVKCLMATDMDLLVAEDYFIKKNK